jgi:hypothetical protein
MNPEEHQTRRSIAVGIKNQLIEEEIGTPSVEDFVFMDVTYEPARIRRTDDGSFWIYYRHPDGSWVSKAPLCRPAAKAIFDGSRIFTAREIKDFKLLGGVNLRGPAAEPHHTIIN